MPIASGTRLGTYQILSQLGAGGMGEVYLAEDSKLGRRLALKVLPAKFTSDQLLVRRFEQEARAASALNHPNIITIHEIGQAEGRHFIATEFVEGQTLRRRMRQPLSIREVLDTAVQMASALSAAHGAGIIHRDIKPENVMLRPDGLVKVLDFGLAKLSWRPAQIIDAEASTLPMVDTDSGVVVGTVAYMSPEQARGLDVDARSDIFSFGVALYEMLARRPPFDGQTASDLIASILKTEPPPLADSAPGVPTELERIVSKALRKDRETRYQTIKDLLSDLEAFKRDLEFRAQLELLAKPFASDPSPSSGHIEPAESGRLQVQLVSPHTAPLAGKSSVVETIVNKIRGHKLVWFITALLVAGTALGIGSYLVGGTSDAAIDSIAVLPFVNGSGDGEDDYLSDGITERLINSLSQLTHLRVPARTTMFRYKGKNRDPLEVGRELGVRAVLTGRVAARESVLNIQVDLVSVAEGSQLWGEQYTRKLAEVQAVQEEIARDVSTKLRLKLTGEEVQRLAKRETNDTEAFDLYLKGRYHLEKRSEEGIKTAIDFFQQAFARDPEFALAYAGLADCYILGGNALPWPETEVRLKAKNAALTALSKDDSLAEAHTSLAVVSMLYDWNWSVAEKEFIRAIELNPVYPTAHHWYAEYLAAMGRHEEAFSEIARARDLDPLSLIINRDVGMHHYYAGRYDEAIGQAENTLKLDRNFVQAHRLIGMAYLKKARSADAIVEFKQVLARSTSGRDRAMLAQAYALAGEPAEARRLLKDLLTEGRVSPYYIAVIYAGLGDQQRAFDSLEKAYREGVSSLVYLKVDPRLESLRRNPKFLDLAKLVGLSR